MNENRFNKERFDSWQAGHQQQAAEMLAMAKAEIPLLFTAERYLYFLDFVSRFHNYSYLNLVLLFKQYPAATYLAPYALWKNIALSFGPDHDALNEKGKKKGLITLIPFTKETLGNKDQKTKYELIYHVANLFDVSQTNHLEIPEAKISYELLPEYIIDVIREITGYGIYEVSAYDDPQLKNQNAYCSVHTKAIFLKKELHPVQQLISLLPLAVDITLADHAFIEERFRLLVRESCVYCLFIFYGLDVSQYTFSSISLYQRYPLDVLEGILHRTQSITHSLIIQIDAWYKERQLSSYQDIEQDLLGLPI